LRIRRVASFSSEDFMKYPIPHAGALAALLLGAYATAVGASGQNRPLSDPANANASVPPTLYAPLSSAPPEAPGAASPADNWKALNKTVASYDSMSLTMDSVAKPPAAPHVGEPASSATPADPHSQHRQKVAK
jgi:hypothetical protein